MKALLLSCICVLMLAACAKNVPADPEIAPWLPQAQAGDPDAMFNIASIYDRRTQATSCLSDQHLKHFSQYQEWCLKAARAGHPQASNDALNLITYLPDKKELRRQFQNNALKGGIPDAEYSMGKAYLEGDGVPKNEDEGFRLIKKAADKGHGNAMNYYGRLFFTGSLVFPDPERAVAIWQKGADQGSVGCMYSLSAAYMLGKGCQKDLAKARYWKDKGLAIVQEHNYKIFHP